MLFRSFVTISWAAAAWVNELALQQLFEGTVPITTVPGDPEANPENYRGSKQVDAQPATVPIFVGMRVLLTKNVNKEMDYVNGMGAVVLGVHATGVRLRTDTGYVIVVYPWTDEEHHVFYPVRVGYASTLMKMQGATIEHMTLYLDIPNVEAAGYVALSRVQYDRAWRFVGDPTVHHFTPASGF